MFGHDQQHHDENSQPAPDGALAHDDQQVTAPQMDNAASDVAGDYMDDVPAPAAPSVTQPDNNDSDNGVSLPAPSDTPDLTAASPADDSAPAAAPNTDKLLEIKQDALQQLTPLVGHLDQSPEEKFRTTMMMIQASDNHELVEAAYEAAKQIADEKVRAQALLDIVNEINYFTHNNASED